MYSLIFMYPRQVPLPMIMSVALLKTLCLSSLLKIVYIVFDVSGKELYSKPTISLRLVFVVLSVIMWRLCYAQAK